MSGTQTGAGDTEATADFGYERVRLSEKQARVDDVFRSVARRYDLMNDLMSGGLHRAWKSHLISMLRPSRTRPHRHLDVAGGTGDIAFRTLEAGGPETHVTVLDINEAMLRVGAERAGHTYDGRIDFVTGNAETLPLPAGHFDSYTIAFGIRNVPRIDVALREAHRVLKPGGRFLCLEFSRVDLPVLEKIYDAYSFHVIPRIGERGGGRPRLLPVPRRVDPQVPLPRGVRPDDRGGGLFACQPSPALGRHRRDPFRLEDFLIAFRSRIPAAVRHGRGLRRGAFFAPAIRRDPSSKTHWPSSRKHLTGFADARGAVFHLAPRAPMSASCSPAKAGSR
jgi:demethylmenaquinone methyltransferase/2-methoxy-6-polyprenyl-1,4-benzoquinol methylase